MYEHEVRDLIASIKLQCDNSYDSLILNPVENIPKAGILFPATTPLHGMYNTDSLRSDLEKIDTKIQFASREQISQDINKIYKSWANLLGAEALTMRLLSGLHAHIILFMSITGIGDKVLLLPEKAGGHMSTKQILERLGLVVKEFKINNEDQRVDIQSTLEIISSFNPKIIFVDRSEGLIYEDFSWLNDIEGCYKIFDASQYLTNILSKDYTNPLQSGFDMILSTLHKNLPGPQRALICVKKFDDVWSKLKSKISTYVSNMHVFSIYSAGLLLGEYDNLKRLSSEMLENTICFDQTLNSIGLKTVSRNANETEPYTHHIWIPFTDKSRAFELYLNLEKIGILLNYRLLPYDIGYGLRLGLSAATYSGVTKSHLSALAEIIFVAYKKGYTEDLHTQSRQLIHRIKEESTYG